MELDVSTLAMVNPSTQPEPMDDSPRRLLQPSTSSLTPSWSGPTPAHVENGTRTPAAPRRSSSASHAARGLIVARVKGGRVSRVSSEVFSSPFSRRARIQGA